MLVQANMQQTNSAQAKIMSRKASGADESAPNPMYAAAFTASGAGAKPSAKKSTKKPSAQDKEFERDDLL